MPQHLIKVSQAYAKSFFGVVIVDNPPPLADQEATTMPSPKRIKVKTGGGTLPLDRDGDPNDLDDPPAHKNGDLF
jgi:hypothetical protein